MAYLGKERRRANNDRATRLGTFLYERTALLAGALVVLYLTLGVTAWGVVETNRKTKQELARIEVLVKEAEASAQFRESLAKIVLEFNEAHARAVADSFTTLNESQQCAVVKFLQVPPALPEEVAACYRPTEPSPPKPKLPTSPNDKPRR